MEREDAGTLQWGKRRRELQHHGDENACRPDCGKASSRAPRAQHRERDVLRVGALTTFMPEPNMPQPRLRCRALSSSLHHESMPPTLLDGVENRNALAATFVPIPTRPNTWVLPEYPTMRKHLALHLSLRIWVFPRNAPARCTLSPLSHPPLLPSSVGAYAKQPCRPALSQESAQH